MVMTKLVRFVIHKNIASKMRIVEKDMMCFDKTIKVLEQWRVITIARMSFENVL